MGAIDFLRGERRDSAFSFDVRPPFLLFLGDAHDDLAAKTAQGLRYWRPEWCIGQQRLEACKPDLGLTDMDAVTAASMGARTMVVGVANRGGVIPDAWAPWLIQALDAGLDLASGLHVPLAEVAGVAEAAQRRGRRLIDVRLPRCRFPLGTGRLRSGRRLLTIGTDCSIGKMFTALHLTGEMKRRGVAVDFRATGQTGTLIAGAGIGIDAVPVDFVSGAVEALCPANEPDHWDVIEGQATLLHPSYGGLTLGILHGAQPHCMVLCHDTRRHSLRGLPDWPLPGLAECIRIHEHHARMTNPEAKVIAVSLNTLGMPAAEAEQAIRQCAEATGLPCVDPSRHGVGSIVELALS